MLRRVLVVMPTVWDRRQLEACRGAWDGEVEVVFGSPSDAACRYDLDPVAWVEEVVGREGGRIDGVLSSSDYPGAMLAGAIAARLGLPGTPPDRLIRASHKHAARLVQQAAVPDAVPWFRLLDPARLEESAAGLAFPCFVKPVKGCYSVLVRQVEDLPALRAHLLDPWVGEFGRDYLAIFNRLVAAWTDLATDGRFFLAEEVLRGDLVTVEGWATDREVGVLGIVDARVDADTRSFLRFDLPSALPPAVQTRVEEVACELARALGLCWTLFNVELLHDPATGRIGVVEVNPRMCGQFADLYEKVDGVNGYRVALDLALGRRPRLGRGAGRHVCAASVPLRVFEPLRVEAAPSGAACRAAEGLFADALAWNEVEAGQVLAEFTRGEDGHSARYGVLNLGGPTREEIGVRAEALRRRLRYRFAPLAPAPRGRAAHEEGPRAQGAKD